MQIKRPRGVFELEIVKTQRVDSDTATQLAALKNELKAAQKVEDKVKISKLEKEISDTRERGLESYPFLASSDLTVERMTEFLASQPEDSENYEMWSEIKRIVEAQLRIKFQQVWFDASEQDEEMFIELLSHPTFSGRQETSAGCLTKAAKFAKAKDSDSATLWMKKANELMMKGL